MDRVIALDVGGTLVKYGVVSMETRSRRSGRRERLDDRMGVRMGCKR